MRGLVLTLRNWYVLILLARVIIDYVMAFNRQWRPHGIVLILVDLVLRLTDPPLRLLRKIVPPLRIGGAAIDFSFIVLMVVLQFLVVPILLSILPA